MTLLNHIRNSHTRLCKICENCALLANGLNACKAKLSVKVSTNPHDIVETYSCDIAEKECILNDCEECKQGQVVDIRVANSSDSNSDTNSDNEIEVNFFRWQYVDRHATKARIALPLEDAIKSFRDAVMVIEKTCLY